MRHRGTENTEKGVVAIAAVLCAFVASLSFTLGALPQASRPAFGVKLAVSLPVGLAPQRVAIADLNGDRKPDLVVANGGSHNATVFLGDGKGGFVQPSGSPFPAGNSPNDIAVGDFNGDKKLDLAFANHEAKYFTVLMGDGRGGFAPAPGSPFAVSTQPHLHMIAAGDFNEDRKLDLVVDSWENSRLVLMWGKGDGSFASAAEPLLVPEIPYHNVRVADVNGDGHLDIVTPAMRRNAVTVLLGDGKGGFRLAEGAPFPAGASPFYLAVGDVNGDGRPDIAVANYSGRLKNPQDDAVNILLGNGQGGFQAAPGSPFSSGHGPTSMALGDVDGDGILDVVVGNLGSGDVTVLLGGKKTITVAPGSPFVVGREPSGVAVGDLNGDGKADIVTANAGSNDVSILLVK